MADMYTADVANPGLAMFKPKPDQVVGMLHFHHASLESSTSVLLWYSVPLRLCTTVYLSC